MVLMAALSAVVVVDGSSNNGIFINASYNNDRHPRPYCPQPLPSSDKEWTEGWRAHRDASHLSLSLFSSLASSLSPLTGQRCQLRQPRRQTRPSCQYPQPGRGRTLQPHWHGATKTKSKSKTKTKTKTKPTTVVATSLPLRLQTATPMLTWLLPLWKQSQQQQQHMCSGGSNSSKAILAAAHYFELPCSITLALPAQQVASSSLLLKKLGHRPGG